MKSKTRAKHFETMSQLNVPRGRNGKHKSVVTEILNDLENLKPGAAIKVPLKGLAESKEKVRSALNRAARKAGLKVQTASDETFLYVWNDDRGGAAPVKQ